MKAVLWKDNELLLLDQTRLPAEVKYEACRTSDEVALAIKEMKVRGAPAIGVSAAYALALEALSGRHQDQACLISKLKAAKNKLAATRPTAVNLFWALEHMEKIWQNGNNSAEELSQRLVTEAIKIDREDEDRNKRMGRNGSRLISDGASILTHCNAGALATAGYGTALGVIRAARDEGKRIHVFADETRPLLQGARLTVWELMEDNIPVTLITDSMAGYLMQQGRIDLVIVGADRITKNGDVANKIGTYSVAVLAHHHRIPFYVAAPLSTIDISLAEGSRIPIEERHQDEVKRMGQIQLAPPEAAVYNPAFDVTPAALVAAIITEEGVLRPPYESRIAGLFNQRREGE